MSDYTHRTTRRLLRDYCWTVKRIAQAQYGYGIYLVENARDTARYRDAAATIAGVLRSRGVKLP